MVFSSFLFLFGFLPLYLLGYYALPSRFKNLFALVASYLFYAWGAPTVVLILLISSTLDYYIAKQFSGPRRKAWFILSIIINVSLLVYYKYANFFIEQTNFILSILGFTNVTWISIALPAGISFFTFHKLSYLTDVYSGRTGRAQTLVNYLLYVAFFPQLIAGPIVRYHDVGFQIEKRTHSLNQIFSGIMRFCLGLAKKVLIADTLGRVADKIFALSSADLTSGYAWLGVLAYAYQIYFDFAGYSDMAIGLARMMGIEFLENFNMPYISQNITEFWRRWHISLSNWMREYLYIPLGGNRLGKARMYANLVIVFLISGLWHGASWTFIVWGIWHGLFLVIDKLFWIKLSSHLPKILNVLITFFVVLIGWVLFRATTFSAAADMFAVMFNFSTFGEPLPNHYRAEIMSNRGIFIFCLATILSFAPLFTNKAEHVKTLWSSLGAVPRLACSGCFSLIIFILSVLAVSSYSFSPFLYFQF
ncbi:MAG: MBOAT family protein [Deltaproteobacteria bacterium]|nr:MBOAT family protein [Deltaproteobacteria bacterium]